MTADQKLSPDKTGTGLQRRRLRIAFALPGLHRVSRGAEMALESVAQELARLGHDIVVFGSGGERVGEPYRFVHVPCVRRERFEKFPSIPFLRTHYSWE